MGDMADFALEAVFKDEELRLDYLSGIMTEQEALDLGMIDEKGFLITYHEFKRKYVGHGQCPKCNGETVLKNGRFGKFYGCSNFPKCNGSRYVIPELIKEKP